MNFKASWISKAINLKLIDRRHLYKYWEQQKLKRLLSHDAVDCVFGIEANYGQYATMLRKDSRYTGLIRSFEPNPSTAAATRKQAAGAPCWFVEEMAVSVA